MYDDKEILVTGGTGLLGTAVKSLLPDAWYPEHGYFDVGYGVDVMQARIEREGVRLIIHAAAVTGMDRCDKNRSETLRTNIIGTANMVCAAMGLGIRLVYVSTDYVFRGAVGDYMEDDDVGPRQLYGWSKLGGECAVRCYDDSLIIRTSFGPDEFPHPKAFIDQWTSRLPVSMAARRIVIAAKSDVTGVLHIGGPRRTVMEYARDVSPELATLPASIHDLEVSLPVDVSLNTSRYNMIFV